jgi:hypothetical protein
MLLDLQSEHTSFMTFEFVGVKESQCDYLWLFEWLLHQRQWILLFAALNIVM